MAVVCRAFDEQTIGRVPLCGSMLDRLLEGEIHGKFLKFDYGRHKAGAWVFFRVFMRLLYEEYGRGRSA